VGAKFSRPRRSKGRQNPVLNEDEPLLFQPTRGRRGSELRMPLADQHHQAVVEQMLIDKVSISGG
jgi:hypothetical protein